MQHIHVNTIDNGGDWLYNLGKATGLIGNMMWDNRMYRDISKELQNNAIDNEYMKYSNQQHALQDYENAIGSNDELGQRNAIAKASGYGLTGLSPNNIQTIKEGLLGKLDYLNKYDKNATIAQRNANNGALRASNYLRNMSW